MIGVEKILNILKIAIWSGGLKGEQPLSVMLIASVGSGKTTMLKKSHQQGKTETITVGKGSKAREIEVRRIAGSVLYTSNTTPYILVNRYGHLLKSGQIKHIAIPDFLNILNLPKHVYANTLNFYNQLIEEGILTAESRESNFVSEIPVNIGLLTAVAKQDFDKRKDEWAHMGFLSRVLPISFTYSKQTAAKIRRSIKLRDYLKDTNSFHITPPANSRNVDLPEDLADEIEQVALRIRNINDPLAARPQKQLQTFCMARALAQGRRSVNSSDIALLYEYEPYFNTNCTGEV